MYKDPYHQLSEAPETGAETPPGSSHIITERRPAPLASPADLWVRGTAEG